jgi:hypothetical protein
MGSGGISPPFLTSALDGNGQLDAPTALTQRKEPSVPTGSEAGWSGR